MQPPPQRVRRLPCARAVAQPVELEGGDVPAGAVAVGGALEAEEPKLAAVAERTGVEHEDAAEEGRTDAGVRVAMHREHRPPLH